MIVLRRRAGTTPVDQTGLDPSYVGGPDVEVAPLSWRWTLPSGEAWELTDWSSPVIKLKGATGAGAPPFTHWWGDASFLEGSNWEGGVTERGELFLVLQVKGVDSADYLVQHRRFMEALDPRKTSVIRVTTPDGRWREVEARYSSGADLQIDVDPVKAHRARYGITWSLADPFALGEPVERLFEYQVPTPFFPGPPWSLGKPHILERAKVENPGHELAYPTWRVTAPYSTFKVGVGESFVRMPEAKKTGWVEIDTHPRKATIVDESGTNLWPLVTDAEFAGIPPGEVDLLTSLEEAAAGSSVLLSFRPPFRGLY